MRTTLIIADDEFYIRQRIKKLIPFEEMNITLLGEADNGIDVLNLIKEDCPMLLLMDIKMPRMDGLEVCQYVYEQNLPIKVILISGYDHFQYAQEALRYRVNNYLLKPLNTEKLLKALEACQEEIVDMQSKEQDQATMIQQMHHSYLNQLIQGESPTLDLFQYEDYCPHADMVILLGIYAQTKEYWDKLMDLLNNAGYYYRIIKEQNHVIYISIILVELESNLKLLQNLSNSLKKLLVPYYYTFSVPFNIHDKNAWKSSAETIREQLKNRYFVEPSSIILSKTEGESITIDKDYRSKLMEYIHMRDLTSLEKLVQRSIADIRLNKNYSYLEFILLEILMALHLCGYEGEKNIHKYVTNLLNNHDKIEDIEEILISHIQQAVCQQTHLPSSQLLVKRLKHYIKKHYLEYDLCINTIATVFQLNPSYTGSVFKKITQTSINTYIHDQRITHAKNLLLDSTINLTDIASNSGYRDVYYFSKRFKRHTGQSPKEFRQRMLTRTT